MSLVGGGRRARRSRAAGLAVELGLVALTAAAAQVSAAAVPEGALKACASIDAATERLTCYDQLAGRKASSSAVTSATPRAAAVAPTPSSVTAAAAAAPGNGTPAPTLAPQALAPPPKEAFGLYRVEHPAAPQGESSITGRIVSMATGANGRPTVALEAEGVWELDGPDLVLSKGDTITIKRAALGSYLMTTPSGRMHRVKRLR